MKYKDVKHLIICDLKTNTSFATFGEERSMFKKRRKYWTYFLWICWQSINEVIKNTEQSETLFHNKPYSISKFIHVASATTAPHHHRTKAKQGQEREHQIKANYINHMFLLAPPIRFTQNWLPLFDIGSLVCTNSDTIHACLVFLLNLQYVKTPFPVPPIQQRQKINPIRADLIP